MTKKQPDEELTPEEIKKAAKEHLVLIEDRKFGQEGYVSVQCSWPALIRFARQVAKLRRPK